MLQQNVIIEVECHTDNNVQTVYGPFSSYETAAETAELLAQSPDDKFENGRRRSTFSTWELRGTEHTMRAFDVDDIDEEQLASFIDEISEAMGVDTGMFSEHRWESVMQSAKASKALAALFSGCIVDPTKLRVKP